jgi:glucose-6-phosphate isomerase
MPTPVKTVTELPVWKALSALSQKVGRLHLRELFAQDPKRGQRFRDLDPAETLFIISSKTFTTLETMPNAKSAQLVARRTWG